MFKTFLSKQESCNVVLGCIISRNFNRSINIKANLFHLKVVDKMVVPLISFLTLPFPVKFELRQFEISRRDLARALCAGVESISKCHNKKVVNTSGVTFKISHEFH